MRNDPIQITRKAMENKIEPFETAETLSLLPAETALLDALADVLEYPDEGWFARFEKCKDLSLSGTDPAAEYFSDFCLDIRELSLTQMQELYTRTFDLNPVCALEVGHHLFGEDYKRGEFLARLRETENPFDLGQQRQLPDYLPVILRLLGRTQDAELRASMIGYCLIPALRKMSEAFAKKNNPYGNLVRFLTETLKRIAKRSVFQTPEATEARYHHA